MSVAAVEEQRQWLAGLVFGHSVDEKPADGHARLTELEKGKTSLYSERSTVEIKTQSSQRQAGNREVDNAVEEGPYISTLKESPCATSTVELELLDFGFAQQDPHPDHPINNDGGTGDDLSFELHLFDRHAKKRRSPDG